MQEAVESTAQHAFRALHASYEMGEAAMAQCPIEAVLLYNSQAVVRLQQLLEAELTRWVRIDTSPDICHTQKIYTVVVFVTASNYTRVSAIQIADFC